MAVKAERDILDGEPSSATSVPWSRTKRRQLAKCNLAENCNGRRLVRTRKTLWLRRGRLDRAEVAAACSTKDMGGSLGGVRVMSVVGNDSKGPQHGQL